MSGTVSATRFSVAIIGMGPRGLSVLERLIGNIRQANQRVDVDIWVIDSHQHGAGRIWRTAQSDVFKMNTVASEVTLYPFDESADLPGDRPTLLEWLHRYQSFDGNEVCSRSVYGAYLTEVFDNLLLSAPPGCHIRPVIDTVTRLDRCGNGYLLTRHSGEEPIHADKVVLATGHSHNSLSPADQELADFAAATPGVRFLAGDSAADMDLSVITKADVVAVKGMGLSFYDVMAALTLGRGGTFERDGLGRLVYRASGDEPRIVAGSRSGLPVLARGRNQKGTASRPDPVFLTAETIGSLRREAERTTGSSQLDFARQVEPLIRLEVEHAYLRTAIRLRSGEEAAAAFSAAYQECTERGGEPESVARRFGAGDLPRLSLEALARPFQHASFPSPASFAAQLVEKLDGDLREAARGNVDGPLKAALDVLRDLRPALCSVVDFGGLQPASHQDFLNRFAPMVALLSTGPPAARVEQLVALLRAGVVTVVGPEAQFAVDAEHERFAVWSPRVAGSRREATVMLDARITAPHLRRDCSPLMRHMVSDGLVSEYVNTGEDGSFATGGLAVTRSGSHVIDAAGCPDPDLYAVGIPTEHTRWFTQVGSSRPGTSTSFSNDAAAIAQDILTAARTLQRRVLPRAVAA